MKIHVLSAGLRRRWPRSRSLHGGVAETPAPAGYDALVRLFGDWRAFERPPLRDGAPDYTAATFARRHAELQALRRPARGDRPDRAGRSKRASTTRWSRAEMNGFDFDMRVLQAVGARPGVLPDASGTSRATRRRTKARRTTPSSSSGRTQFPLSRADEAKLAAALAVVPPLLAQARAAT